MTSQDALSDQYPPPPLDMTDAGPSSSSSSSLATPYLVGGEAMPEATPIFEHGGPKGNVEQDKVLLDELMQARESNQRYKKMLVNGERIFFNCVV